MPDFARSVFTLPSMPPDIWRRYVFKCGPKSKEMSTSFRILFYSMKPFISLIKMTTRNAFFKSNTEKKIEVLPPLSE